MITTMPSTQTLTIEEMLPLDMTGTTTRCQPVGPGPPPG